MRIEGLLVILKVMFNSLLKKCKLSLYKIASNHQRSTLVLRFDSLCDPCIGVSNLRSEHVSLQQKSTCQPKPKQRTKKQSALLNSTNTTTLSTTDTSILPNLSERNPNLDAIKPSSKTKHHTTSDPKTSFASERDKERSKQR